MRPLSPSERERLLALVVPALDIDHGLGAFFKPSFLDDRGWSAVVFGADFADAGCCVSTPLRERGIVEAACGGLTEYPLEAFLVDCDHESMKRVRREYVEPSYFVTDGLRTFCLVSDSDYYWGLAADPAFVALLGDPERNLDAFEADLQPYRESADAHDRRIGTMLRAHLSVCRGSWRP